MEEWWPLTKKKERQVITLWKVGLATPWLRFYLRSTTAEEMRHFGSKELRTSDRTPLKPLLQY